MVIIGVIGFGLLLDLLVGFQRPDRGSIMFAGQPVEHPSARGILITQKESVFPWITAWKSRRPQCS